MFITPILTVPGSVEAAGPGGADIYIDRTHVQPVRQESSTLNAKYTVAITLTNRGNASGVVRLTVSDSGGTFLDEPVSVDANRSKTATITWVVKGAGKHNATAVLSGENASLPATADLACELAYVPVENPSPWYTIPCAFLFIIIPSIAIWLIIRRMKGGDWLERAGKR